MNVTDALAAACIPLAILLWSFYSEKKHQAEREEIKQEKHQQYIYKQAEQARRAFIYERDTRDLDFDDLPKIRVLRLRR